MLFDCGLSKEIDAVADDAARVQAETFDGGWIGETRHDPFIQVTEAGRATTTRQVGTAVAIAFARSPMTVANSAYDLAAYTRGRFVLGLGSQVKPHIERRFGMPWSSPAARMGEFVHAFSTPRYIAEVTDPALQRGCQRVGREDLDGFTIAGPVFACVGRDDVELAAAIAGTKAQIAFDASTPAYRAVLDLHGWGDVQSELTRLSKARRWIETSDAVDDEMLHAFAVVGDPETVGRQIWKRYSTLMDRVSFYAPYPHDPSIWPRFWPQPVRLPQPPHPLHRTRDTHDDDRRVRQGSQGVSRGQCKADSC